jgi:hypothetical protein
MQQAHVPAKYIFKDFTKNPPEWKDVTDATTAVLPGHQITLKVECPIPTPAPTNIQWTVPDTAFANYEANANTATKTDLGNLTSDAGSSDMEGQ